MLVVEDLTFKYEDTGFSIRNINFKLNEGELLGIIGPSGSGKSTLIKCLSKIIMPKSGKIIIDDKDINDFNSKEMAKRIAIVPQFAENYDQGFSVYEFVLMGRTPHRNNFQLFETKRDRLVTEKALNLTGIENIALRDISTLSGGEKQRIIIGRALCQEPQLLLLDEPTNHLDIGHQLEVMELLRDLNYKGHSVIAILHDINLASLFCDKLILLDDGEIYSEGTPKQVINEKTIKEVYETEVRVEVDKLNLKPNVLLNSRKRR